MKIIQVPLDKERQVEIIEKKVAELLAEGWAGVANGKNEKSNISWPWRTNIRSRKAKAEHYVFYSVSPRGLFVIWDRVKPTPEALDKAKEKASREKAIQEKVAKKLTEAEEAKDAEAMLRGYLLMIENYEARSSAAEAHIAALRTALKLAHSFLDPFEISDENMQQIEALINEGRLAGVEAASK